MRLPIVHHPAFVAELPKGHRFPMGKFGRLKDRLVAEGLASADGFAVPAPAPKTWLTLAHEESYVEGVIANTLPKAVERRIGLPVTPAVALRSRLAVGGTVLAAHLALETGIACHTAGGSHHAAWDGGAGFCVFNDVAVAAHVLLAEGRIRRALVIDCDVHQGDGTAALFRNDERVVTMSIHCEKNYPHRKKRSDLDIGLLPHTGDRAYLETLRAVVPDMVNRVRPDIVFYNAGVDPHKDDRLGRLDLSDEGLAERDAFILNAVCERNVPVVGVLGGGYSDDLDALAARHVLLHKAAQLCLNRKSAYA